MLCIICLQGNKTTMRHLLEWPESRTLTTPSASKDTEHMGPSPFLGRVWTITTTSQNKPTVPKKAIQVSALKPSNLLSRNIPSRNAHICLQETRTKYWVCNGPKLEETLRAMNARIAKLWSRNRLLYSSEKSMNSRLQPHGQISQTLSKKYRGQ